MFLIAVNVTWFVFWAMVWPPAIILQVGGWVAFLALSADIASQEKED